MQPKWIKEEKMEREEVDEHEQQQQKDIVGIFSGVTAHFERVHWINSQQQPTATNYKEKKMN